MMKYAKHIIAIFLVITMLFTGTDFAAAEENNGESQEWALENVKFGHLGVSFEFNDFLPPQEAKAVISSSDSSEEGQAEIAIEFTIEDGKKEYQLPIPEGSYLEGGKNYCLKVYGQNEGEASEYGEVECGFSAEIYYERDRVDIDYKSDCRIVQAVAEVDSIEYEGVVGDSNIVISYPLLISDQKVTVKIFDEYGCVWTYNGKTERSDSLRYMDLKALPDEVRFEGYIGLAEFSADERMAVKVGEEIYYTEYGYQADAETRIGRVRYPLQQPGTRITVWMEDKSGAITLKKKFTVKECSFYEGRKKAYPEMLTGTVSKGFLQQTPTKVCVRIGGKVYEDRVDPYGNYTVMYPEQQKGAELTFYFMDDHGCCQTQTTRVCNEFVDVSILEEYNDRNSILDVTTTAVYAEPIVHGRICVQIGRNVYKGSSEEVEHDSEWCLMVSYPEQKPGTPITVWYEDLNTSKGVKMNFKIPSPPKVKLDIVEFTYKYIEFEPHFYLGDSDYSEDIEKAYIYINGKKYKAKVDGDSDAFYLKYSAKVGSTMKIVIIDEEDNEYELVYKVPHTLSEIHLNKVESGSWKVTGDTEPKASVSVKIGKKTYKSKAKKDGSFSVKIKPHKTGTKVTLFVKTKEGAYGKRTTKIKRAKGTISISHTIYRDSGKVSCKVTGAYKGDIVTVKVGDRTYKKRITSNKRRQTVSVPIGLATAGEQVRATYSDRFKKRKDYDASRMVYFGDSIYVGMSINDACLTTWGKPKRRNYYGGNWEQWVFSSGGSMLFVYVQDGKVVFIQRMNY